MLEDELQTLFRLQADGDLPPSAISVPAADRRARLMRRRRAAAIASPALAAAAVLAVVTSGNLLGSAPARSTPVTTGAAPRYFNPLRPYAAFGWLPEGASAQSSSDTLGQDVLMLQADAAFLTVHAYGRCRVIGEALTCNVDGASGGPQPLGRMVGTVEGHPAYWVRPNPKESGSLAWQYARGGWAVLTIVPNMRDALRIADGIRFGPDVSSPVRFAFQLTGVPADWQVNAVSGTQWPNGRLDANSFQITAGHVDAAPQPDPYHPSATPDFWTGPTRGNSCHGLIDPRPTVINGYQVILWSNNRFVPRWPQHALCAPDVNGLQVAIDVGAARQVISPAELFGHHMRLFGSDPANWTTQPIG
jgi:hypothetical protein